MLDAQEQGNSTKAEEAAKAMELKVKSFARDIRDKYISPPETTDFGIMFCLPKAFMRRYSEGRDCVTTCSANTE